MQPSQIVILKQRTLKDEVGQADIVVCAVGKSELIKKSWLKDGAIVIDAGYNFVNGKTVGDVENPEGIASFILQYQAG